jgi:thiol:disulfide interchange protein DsbC
MKRWLSTALVFTLGSIAGWTAVAVGSSKSAEKEKDKPPVVTKTISKASAVAAKNPAELEGLRNRLAKKIPDIDRDDITATPIAGVYQVRRGHLFGYVSGDGRYLIQGDLVDIDTGEEITENFRRLDRLNALKSLGNEYIEFAPAPPVETKYTVTVFTDIDCGYCRKLHNEMAAYNKNGIAMRYLFFPRSGPDTPSFEKAESVWCSEDRRDALTRAKRGEKVAASPDCKNPIGKEYQLGVELGVRGTPALVLPNGDLYPGYVPAQQLVSLLAGPQMISKEIVPEMDPENVAP